MHIDSNPAYIERPQAGTTSDAQEYSDIGPSYATVSDLAIPPVPGSGHVSTLAGHVTTEPISPQELPPMDARDYETPADMA